MARLRLITSDDPAVVAGRLGSEADATQMHMADDDRENRESILEILDELRERVTDGRIVAVAIAAVGTDEDGDNTTATVFSEARRNTGHAMLTALRILQHRYFGWWYDTCDSFEGWNTPPGDASS